MCLVAGQDSWRLWGLQPASTSSGGVGRFLDGWFCSRTDRAAETCSDSVCVEMRGILCAVSLAMLGGWAVSGKRSSACRPDGWSCLGAHLPKCGRCSPSRGTSALGPAMLWERTNLLSIILNFSFMFNDYISFHFDIAKRAFLFSFKKDVLQSEVN